MVRESPRSLTAVCKKTSKSVTPSGNSGPLEEVASALRSTSSGEEGFGESLGLIGLACSGLGELGTRVCVLGGWGLRVLGLGEGLFVLLFPVFIFMMVSKIV